MMTPVSKQELSEQFSEWKPNRVIEIIDKLAGQKSNLRVEIGEIRLTIGEKEYEIAGRLELNVLHKKKGSMSYDTIEASPQSDDALPAFQSGKVHVYTGDLEVLRINVEGKRIDLDVEDKQFIKRAIKLRDEISPKNKNLDAQEKKAQKKSSSPLATIRTIADTCKKLGITLTVSYRGHRIVTVGTEARPTLLQLVTKTRALALNSLYTAIELMV
ncbi:MAG: hypothetical protein ACHQ1H_00140 [Nitrososphaerales archaeon]